MADSSGTATTLRPAGVPRVKILRKGPEGKSIPAGRRFVYCWENAGSKWKPVGLFLTNKYGILFNVEDDVRKEYSSLSQPTGSSSSKQDSLKFLNPKVTVTDLLDEKKYQPFRPLPKKEYFFTFLPVELLFHSDYSSKHTHIKAWADGAILLDAPPDHWLQKPQWYGAKTVITNTIINSGIELPVNWLEWLADISRILRKFNWYTAYSAARKLPYLKTTTLLDLIADLLEGTALCADKIETGSKAKELARDYSLYHLDTFANKIRDKYLAENMLQKEQMAYRRFADQMIGIINNDIFKRTFLCYVIADKKCDGNGGSALDPVHFLLPDRIDEIIRTAYAVIIYHPSETLVKSFYNRTILPVELKLGDTLDNDERAEIKNLFNDPELIDQFMSGCTPTQKKSLNQAIDEGLKPLSDANELAKLEKEIPGVKKMLEDMDAENPIWNWIKDSAQDNIDGFLGVFLQMRESWAAEEFGKAPKLKPRLMTSLKRTTIALRITKAAYKKYKTGSGGTTAKVATRSAKDYTKFLKKRLLDKNKWITDEDGKKFGSTPVNLNMAFSAIGLFVSMQGIYSFVEKCTSKGNKPELDDYVDLYKSLSSGASSFIGLMPEVIADSAIVKVLKNVFIPFDVACDVNCAYKLIKKSKLYYAQGRLEKSLFEGINAGIKLGSAGFTMLSLFRWKALSKFLLKREVLLQTGAKALGFAFSFALIGCEVFKWYLGYIEPQAQKITKKQVMEELEKLINEDPRKKNETIKETIHGVELKVPKINYFEEDLHWKDSKTFQGKEIYCDEERTWDWLKLKDLINDEMVGVSPLKGLGWITEYNEEKALFELVERGVQVELVGKICGRTKEEVEGIYRKDVKNRFNLIEDVKKRMHNDTNKRAALIQALS